MKHQGFTLLELAATIVIVAILATIAIPSFLGSVERNKLRSSSEELYHTLYTARSKAVTDQQLIYLSFNTGSNWCVGVNTGGYCDCTNPSSCLLGTVRNKNDKVSLALTGFTGGQNQILAGRGMFATSGDATFNLNDKSVNVNVAKMGRIRICSSTVGGYKPC